MPAAEQWMQWIVVGLCFGVGFCVAQGVCSLAADVLTRRRSKAP